MTAPRTHDAPRRDPAPLMPQRRTSAARSVAEELGFLPRLNGLGAVLLRLEVPAAEAASNAREG